MDAALPDQMVLPDPSSWGTVTNFLIDRTAPATIVIDSSGTVAISSASATGRPTQGYGVIVTAADIMPSTETTVQYGSGVARFEVWSGSGTLAQLLGVNTDSGLIEHYDQDSTGLSILGLLPEGWITLMSFDAVQNTSTITFLVDRTSPTAQALDFVQNSIGDGGTTQSSTIYIVATDAGSGIAEMDFPGFDPLMFEGESVATGTFEGVESGVYLVKVIDAAGNVHQVDFTVSRPEPSLSFTDGDRIAYQAVQGPQTDNPSSTHLQYSFEINDPLGVQSITAPGSVSITVPAGASPSNIPPGTNHIVGVVNLSGSGPYFFSVANTAGTTSVLWRVVDLSVALAPTSTAVLEGTSIHARAQLDYTSTLGVTKVPSFNGATPDVIGDATSGYLGDFPEMISATTATYTRLYYVTDGENNQTLYSTVYVDNVAFGVGFSSGGVGVPGSTIKRYSAMSALSSATVNPGVLIGFPTLGPSAYMGQTWGAMAGGDPIILSTGLITYANVSFGPGTGTGPIGGTQAVGSVKVYLMTGDQPDPMQMAREQEIAEGNISLLSISSPTATPPYAIKPVTSFNFMGAPMSMDLYTALRFEITTDPQPNFIPATCTLVDSANFSNCLGGNYFTPNLDAAVSFITPFLSTGVGSYGGFYSPGVIFPGGPYTISLAPGVSVIMSAHDRGFLSLNHRMLSLPGWTDINGAIGYQIEQSQPGFVDANFIVTLPLNTLGLDAATLTNIKVLYFPDDPVSGAPSICGPPDIITPTINGNSVTFAYSKFGTFKVTSSIFGSAAIASLNGLRFTSNAPGVDLQPASGDQRISQLLSVIGGRGLAVAGTGVIAGPTGRTFSPPAVFSYTPPGQVPGTVGTAQFHQFSLDGTGDQFIAANYDAACNSYNGVVGGFHSFFGLFTATTPVPAVDLLPPQTTLLIGGSAIPNLASVTVASTVTISLSALDPPYPGAPVSGVASTLYAADVPFVSITLTPGQPYTSSFNLSIGTHTLFYYSVDHAGNVESVHLMTVVVNPPQTRSVAGLGLGLDPASRLWSVAFDSGSVAIARNDGNGVLVASSTLPGADTAFPWNLLFDQSGTAYAVGAAIANNGADQLAVYKASPSGDAIVASEMFDSGFNNNNLVFGVAAPGWIAGAVQTSGPIDNSANGNRTYAMALWKFDPTSGLIQLTTTYARAGMDLASGVAVDGSGNLWLAGFSYSPNPRSPRAFDLAVWKYASDGHTLLAGPFFREGYLGDFNTQDTARVLVSSGVVYVTAPRGRGAGGTDTALISFDATSGRVLSENAWRSADGASSYPSTILQDSSGHLVVVGGFDYGDTVGGIWRYGSNGGFLSATQTNSGGAQGGVFSGSNLWLIVDGSTSPYLDSSETTVSGALSDVQPPRTTLASGLPSYSAGALFVSSAINLGFTAVDDKLVVGDGLGVGVAQTLYTLDSQSYSQFTSSFQLVAEGTHTVSFYSLDSEGNAEVANSTTVAVDLTGPVAHLVVASSTTFSISAQDPVVNGAASGVAQVIYLVDVNPQSCNGGQLSTAPAGTCANPNYAGPFTLSVGTHTVYFQAVDNVGNGANVVNSSFVVVSGGNSGFAGYALNPSTGPIGIPFAVTGPGGFGAYNGGNTRVLFGAVSAPLSVWNDTTIDGSIPNLSTGTYSVTVAIGTNTLGVGSFTVLYPTATSINISSGPIGSPFTIAGAQFGPYGGGLTRVLIGGATAPLSLWNDNAISGSIPALSTGTYAVQVQRATGDGGLMSITPFSVQVIGPSPTGLTPSSGPIGVPFTITGSGFGAYGGGNTVVQVGGVNAPLSVWNDTTISGSIPNLSTGSYSVVVERISGSNISSAALGGFTVLPLSPTGFSPSSGSIGVPFAITGSAFGPYAGGLTRVLFDGTQAALSVWNDANIAGTVPALSTGAHAVWIERASSDGGLESSGTVYFTVTAPNPTGFTPTSGPIGTAFTITGSGFGPYAGGNTRVLIGGVSAPLSLWNDSQISGSIPALSSGTTAVWIERQAGTGVQSSGTTYFNITVPAVASFSPSSAPIGAPFTFLGSSFGSYAGGNTVVLFNGIAAPLSVWNDGQVSGSVPGSLSTGTYSVVLQITAAGGSVQTSSQAFTVLTPTIQTMSPASGPAGTGVQLTGFGFGPYGGGATQVLLGTTTVPLSVWNDGRIVWTVPSGVPDGNYPVVVSLTPPGGTVQSASMTFTVGSGSGGLALALRTAAPLSSQPDWHFEGGLLISTVTGGNIQSPSQAAVSVPAGALSTAAVVTMARDHNSYASARAAALTASSLGAGGEAVSFGPEGTQFAHPVTLVLPYDPALVPDGKLGDLAIHYYDPASKSWTPLVTTADPIRHVVTAQTTHFSLYQPLGHGIGVAAADATFGLKAAYAFPNPVHSGAVRIRIQPGLADSASVRIYDLSGKKVHDSSNFTQSTLDDGNGLGAQFTYDHDWDISGVGSGVYTFVITAKKAGQSDIHKTGKIGVSK
jgi:hypothetical protein